MDLNKLSTGRKLFIGGAIVYLIAYFLPWFTVDAGPLGTISASGGDVGALFGTLWMLLFLIGAILLALPAFGVKAPAVPPIAYLAVGALGAFFTTLKLLIGESDGGLDLGISRGFGLILATLAAIGTAFGAFTFFKESGGSIDDLKDVDRLKQSFGASNDAGNAAQPPTSAPGGFPPPPPPPSSPQD